MEFGFINSENEPIVNLISGGGRVGWSRHGNHHNDGLLNGIWTRFDKATKEPPGLRPVPADQAAREQHRTVLAGGGHGQDKQFRKRCIAKKGASNESLNINPGVSPIAGHFGKESSSKKNAKSPNVRQGRGSSTSP